MSSPGTPALLKSGTLRAGLFLPQFFTDPATGQLRGLGTGIVGIDLAHALAAQLGVAAQILQYSTPSKALAAIKQGSCDIAYMGIEPTRQAELDFSNPAFQFDYTYLVPAGSDIHKAADADRPGIRIAVVGNHASTLALARQVQHAELIGSEIPDEAFALLRDGSVDAFAMPREVLEDYAPQLPGSRVLEDRFGVNNVGIAIAKGQSELLACLNTFVEAAKASGLIADSIARGNMPFFRAAPAGAG